MKRLPSQVKFILFFVFTSLVFSVSYSLTFSPDTVLADHCSKTCTTSIVCDGTSYTLSSNVSHHCVRPDNSCDNAAANCEFTGGCNADGTPNESWTITCGGGGSPPPSDTTAPVCENWTFDPAEPSNAENINVTARASDSGTGISRAGLYVRRSNGTLLALAANDHVYNPAQSPASITRNWSTSGFDTGDYMVYANFWDDSGNPDSSTGTNVGGHSGNFTQCSYEYTINKTPPTATVSGPSNDFACQWVTYGFEASMQDDRDLSSGGIYYTPKSTSNWSAIATASYPWPADTSRTLSGSQLFDSGDYYVTVNAYDSTNNKCSGNPQVSSYPTTSGWYACDGGSSGLSGNDYIDLKVRSCGISSSIAGGFVVNGNQSTSSNGQRLDWQFTNTSNAGTATFDTSSGSVGGKENICHSDISDCWFVINYDENQDLSSQNKTKSLNLGSYSTSTGSPGGYTDTNNVFVVVDVKKNSDDRFPSENELETKSYAFKTNFNLNENNLATSAFGDVFVFRDGSGIQLDWDGDQTDVRIAPGEGFDIEAVLRNRRDIDFGTYFKGTVELFFAPPEGKNLCMETDATCFLSPSSYTLDGSSDEVDPGMDITGIVDVPQSVPPGNYEVRIEAQGRRSEVNTHEEDDTFAPISSNNNSDYVISIHVVGEEDPTALYINDN